MGRTFKEKIKKSFSPTNSFIMFINILLFALVIVFWFWFVGSQQLYVVIDKKAENVVNIMDQNNILKSLLTKYIDGVKNDTELLDNTRKLIINRNNYNIDLLHKYFIAPFSILAGIIVLYLLYIYIYRSGLGTVDIILIFIMLLSFITEIIFYIVVITDFPYITNSKLFGLVMGVKY